MDLYVLKLGYSDPFDSYGMARNIFNFLAIDYPVHDVCNLNFSWQKCLWLVELHNVCVCVLDFINSHILLRDV